MGRAGIFKMRPIIILLIVSMVILAVSARRHSSKRKHKHHHHHSTSTSTTAPDVLYTKLHKKRSGRHHSHHSNHTKSTALSTKVKRKGGKKEGRFLGIVGGIIDGIGQIIGGLSKALQALAGSFDGTVKQCAFVPVWTQVKVDFSIVFDLSTDYYCDRYGPLHCLCAYKNPRPGWTYYGYGLDPETIKFILGYFNAIRKNFLVGIEAGLGFQCPTAYNLCVLTWSEELQMVAQLIANQMATSLNASLNYSTDKFPKLTVTIASQTSNKRSAKGVKADWNYAMNEWYVKQKPHVTRDMTYQPNSRFGDFAAIVWGNTYQVGCGTATAAPASGGAVVTVFVCVWGPSGNIPGQPIFTQDNQQRKGNQRALQPKTKAPVKNKSNQRFLGAGINASVSVSLSLNFFFTNPFCKPPRSVCYVGGIGKPVVGIVIAPQPDPKPKPTQAPPPQPTEPPPPPPPPPTEPPAAPPTAGPKPPPAPKPTAGPKPPPAPKPTAGPKPPPAPKPTAGPKPAPTPKPPPKPKRTHKPTPKTTPKPCNCPCIPEKATYDKNVRKFIIQQPYMVMITYEPLVCQGPQKLFRCTGVIYNSQHILTSYQCALPSLLRKAGKTTHKEAVIHYGDGILGTGKPQDHLRHVVDVRVPDKLDLTRQDMFDNLDSNIALLKINSKITFTKYTKAIKLAFNDVGYVEHNSGYFSGWTVNRGAKSIDIVPTKVHFKIVPTDQTKKLFPDINTEFRFVGKVSKGAGQNEKTCYEDLGGPAITILLKDNHQAPVPTAEAYVIGVLPASFCHRKEDKKDDIQVGYEYFTTVHKFNDWVSKTAGVQDMDWDM